ncbi:hypothetical protein C8Q73DRAFT_376168 [Cubamyces lactineus]|nr:hypothetical protein C8Q73DRAFT_376168 [Cubamyces lactineus]
MPLQHSPDPAEPSWVQGVTADFLIFYSSRDESGKLWCPVRPRPCLRVVNIRPDRTDPDFLASSFLPYPCQDCVAVENVVEQTFGSADGPSAVIVYVGQRTAWKTPSNPYRTGPWNVSSIPTVVRSRDGARLVEEEISERLAAFVRE